MTRFFRPPEVILLEKNYDCSVDIWSFGCIASEIVTCSEEYQRNGFNRNRRTLFKGKHCYPLSPNRNSKIPEDKGDQLKTILGLMGRVNEQDMSFITSKDSILYLKSLMKENVPKDKIDFKCEMEFSDSRLCRVLSHSLEFNPYFRYPAKSLLKSSYFDDVRDPELEKNPIGKVELPFECHDDHSLSYLTKILDREIGSIEF